MAFEFEGKIYRNLEEQVDYNKDCINDLDLRVDALEKIPEFDPTKLDLNIGTYNLTYDTNTGINLSTAGTMQTKDGSIYDLEVSQEMPIVPGAGIVIDKKETEDKIEIKANLSNGKEAGKIALYYDQGQWPGTSDAGNGYLVSSDPTSPYHVANKKYVDGTFIKQPQTNKEWSVLVIDPTDTNIYYKMSTEVEGSTIPYRDYASKNFKVGDLADDADGSWVTNKRYVDTHSVKPINVTENTYVYAASSEGPNGRLRVSSTVEGGIVVQTSADATVRTNNPTYEYDAVNLRFFNTFAVRQDNMKTLFGNQSIAGSGNIDLFNHDIKITLGTGSDEKYAELYVTRVSSKNLNIDSFTDFKTLIGDATIGVSGFTVLSPVGETVRKRSAMAVNSTQIISNYGSTIFQWSDFTSMTFQDTVTTV